MTITRWAMSLLFLACVWLALGFPAVGLLLAIATPPPLAPPDGEPRQEGDRRVLGASYREAVGGLWHLHLEGSPAQIGYAHGSLAGDLTGRIEAEMMETFVRLVPSFLARHAVLGLVGLNNRSLPDHFTAEERTEIAASVAGNVRYHDAFRAAFPHYTRALQYHALHDISHYLIDNPFINAPQIGCTAVAVGGARSSEGHLLVGRLFDFEGGREFDRHKVVMTVRPQRGHAFVSVAWAGLSGAVTGLNQAGLWVSINAGETRNQSYVGRPMVMVVREILQHCATIAEAETVLRRSPVFVSDGVLIASASERRAVVAELGPSGLAMRPMADDRLALTNHFLADRWRDDPHNLKRLREGTSTERFRRAEELLLATPLHDPSTLLDLLRDRRGPGGQEVGFGNRATINAWIGAHLVVADLDRLVLWVAEPSHGLGRALAFGIDGPLPLAALPASPDLELHDRVAERWETLRERLRDLLGDQRHDEAEALVAELVALNPDNFESHLLTGLASADPAARRRAFERALGLHPAYPRDRRRIEALLAPGPAAPP